MKMEWNHHQHTVGRSYHLKWFFFSLPTTRSWRVFVCIKIILVSKLLVWELLETWPRPKTTARFLGWRKPNVLLAVQWHCPCREVKVVSAGTCMENLPILRLGYIYIYNQPNHKLLSYPLASLLAYLSRRTLILSRRFRAVMVSQVILKAGAIDMETWHRKGSIPETNSSPLKIHGWKMNFL